MKQGKYLQAVERDGMSASLIVDTLARGRECYRLRWGSNSKQRIEGYVDSSSTAEQIEAYRQKALAARLKKHEQLNESRQDVSRQKLSSWLAVRYEALERKGASRDKLMGAHSLMKHAGRYFDANMRVGQLRHTMLEEFVEWLYRDADYRRGLAPKTISKYVGWLSEELERARLDRELDINAASRLKLSQVAVKPPKPVLSKQELKAMTLAAMQLNSVPAAIVMRAGLWCYFTAMGATDCRKLKWTDLSTQEKDGTRIVTYSRSKMSRDNAFRRWQPLVETHRVPLAPFAEEILAVQRRLHPASELVFPDMPKRQVIDRQMKRIREAAGIEENVTFYCFRHTCLTTLKNARVDSEDIRKHAGHSTQRMLKTYSQHAEVNTQYVSYLDLKFQFQLPTMKSA